jgi:hypothetical protein
MRALESLDGYAKAASNNFNTGVAKQFSAQWIVFSGGLAQTSFKAFNKTVLPECLCKQAASTNSKPYEGP